MDQGETCYTQCSEEVRLEATLKLAHHLPALILTALPPTEVTLLYSQGVR